MNDTSETPAGSNASDLKAADAIHIAVAISRLIINTIDQNWLSKMDETEGVADCFDQFSAALAKTGEITIRVAGDTLKVNQHEVIDADPAVKRLTEQISALGINNFTMEHGMTTDTLANLLEVLSATSNDIEALGGFATALEKCGIDHIQSRTVIYREVTEDDVVVSREHLKQAEDDVDKSENIHERVGNVAEMLDFLKSSKEGLDPEGLSALQELSADAQRMSEMVIQAAELKKEEAEEEARETIAGALVVCVRRAFTSLMKDPSLRTQKGKKELQKKLKAFEQEVVGMIDDMDEADQEPCKAAVKDAVESISDEIQVDSLASEYMKRLRAVEKTEKRLMRYIKVKGEDVEGSELETRLHDDGLSFSHWQNLILKSGGDDPPGLGPGGGMGPGPGGGPGDGTGGLGTGGMGSGFESTSMEHLVDVLTRMEQTVGALADQSEEESQEAFDGMLTQVSSEIGNLVDGTAQKIKNIASEVQADIKAAEAAEQVAEEQGIGLILSRRKLLEMLIEVSQELCQPLAVIKCSIEMIMTRRLGEIPERQQSMLEMISDSTLRLNALINGLMEISGVPDSLSPDRELLDKVTRE